MAFKRMIQAIDTHAGTSMHVITGGVPHIPGASVYEKMKWLEKNDDHLRYDHAQGTPLSSLPKAVIYTSNRI